MAVELERLQLSRTGDLQLAGLLTQETLKIILHNGGGQVQQHFLPAAPQGGRAQRLLPARVGYRGGAAVFNSGQQRNSAVKEKLSEI